MKSTLRRLVYDRGLRQDWLAEKLGIAESTLSKYLSGALALPMDQVEPFAGLLQTDAATVATAAVLTRKLASGP
jgi:transcriptional regulator with XRE-family HTH domain